MICGLQGLGQYDLAEQWTQAMEQWRHGCPAVGSIHGRCRVHRAEVLRLSGFNSEAEKEALLACEELRPYLQREFGWPLTELGRIRLRKGDLDGAEQAFIAAHQAGWDPQPGLALVSLARGNVAQAAESIRDALEHPSNAPSKELPPSTQLRRAPLPEAQVEIAVAAGDLERARRAAQELGNIASRFGSRALEASAAAAGGSTRLAEGDAAGARGDFEAAVQLWGEIGAPYEMAHEARTPEARAPEATVEPAASVFCREGEYWCVAFEGRACATPRDFGTWRSSWPIPGRSSTSSNWSPPSAAGTSELGDDDRAESELTLSMLGDAGQMLDARAKSAYRRRLAEIDEDIEEARAAGDMERDAQANTERDFLLRELSRAVGLGGRNRRAGSASERARVSVTRAIRFSMARIREYNPGLGEHLERCVRTGSCCAYCPDPRVPMVWKL